MLVEGLQRVVGRTPMAGLAWLLVAGSALAGPAAPTRAPAIQSILDCRALQDAPQRLACYDKAVAGMSQAESKGDLVTIDRAQRQTVRRQAFGLILPSLAMFDRGERPEEADRITASVSQAWKSAAGKWMIRLDDGAVWRQVDDNELFKPPHAGSMAKIRKAALGSYFMNLDGQIAIRVHRDN